MSAGVVHRGESITRDHNHQNHDMYCLCSVIEHFNKTVYVYWVEPLFALKTASVLRGIDYTRCQENSFDILVLGNMITLFSSMQVFQMHLQAVTLFCHVP